MLYLFSTAAACFLSARLTWGRKNSQLWLLSPLNNHLRPEKKKTKLGHISPRLSCSTFLARRVRIRATDEDVGFLCYAEYECVFSPLTEQYRMSYYSLGNNSAWGSSRLLENCGSECLMKGTQAEFWLAASATTFGLRRKTSTYNTIHTWTFAPEKNSSASAEEEEEVCGESVSTQITHFEASFSLTITTTLSTLRFDSISKPLNIRKTMNEHSMVPLGKKR